VARQRELAEQRQAGKLREAQPPRLFLVHGDGEP
jgi:hypothetical protein